MKTRKVAFTIILLLAIGLFLFLTFPNKKQEKQPVIKSKKLETSSIQDTILNTKEKDLKKLNDTTLYLYFDELSDVYNYKIIDCFYANNLRNKYDSLIRKIKILDKKDSLIQIITPEIFINPIHFFNLERNQILARSFITNKNTKAKVIDDDMGQIAVADLNFDGLEDFATPTDHGADNGYHYSFYIQQKNKRFKFNKYLTDEVIWFPEKFNDSLRTFTTILSAGVWGIGYHSYKYDTIKQKWRETNHYAIDIKTGKVVK